MDTYILSFALSFGKRILTTVITWYQQVYEAMGMTSLWIGVVILSAVFSIVIIPLRGGADLSRGALGSFLMNKVNRHKRNDD